MQQIPPSSKASYSCFIEKPASAASRTTTFATAISAIRMGSSFTSFSPLACYSAQRTRTNDNEHQRSPAVYRTSDNEQSRVDVRWRSPSFVDVRCNALSCQCGLGRCQLGNGYSERTATDIIQADPVTKLDAFGVAPVLTTNT